MGDSGGEQLVIRIVHSWKFNLKKLIEIQQVYSCMLERKMRCLLYYVCGSYRSAFVLFTIFFSVVVLTDAPKEPSLVLILKWGGELTPAGRIQAEELGRIFRCMYPGGQGRHLSGS
jgi:hypothetical protein